jgi:hypothetical protein
MIIRPAQTIEKDTLLSAQRYEQTVISNHDLQAYKAPSETKIQSLRTPYKRLLIEDTKRGDGLRGRAIHQSILQLGGYQVESTNECHSNKNDASHTKKDTRVCAVHQAKYFLLQRMKEDTRTKSHTASGASRRRKRGTGACRTSFC